MSGDERGAASLPTAQEGAAAVAKLQQLTKILDWAHELRGWSPQTLASLRVGWGNLGLPVKGDRFVFGMHDERGRLINVRGYMPPSSIKMVGLRGRPLQLWPCPELTWPTSSEIWLVEGEPDAITAREAWPMAGVIAVPGAATWKREWAPRLARYARVHICMDADDAGDLLAERAAKDLAAAGASYSVHHWSDFTGTAVEAGYDLSDWVRDHPDLLAPPTV